MESRLSFTPQSTVNSNLSTETPIVVRSKGNGKGFTRSVSCNPGSITVFVDEENGKANLFRNEILNLEQSTQVTLMYGASKVHPSELHYVRAGQALWSESNLIDIFYRSGAPENLIAFFLRELELEEVANSPAEALRESELRRVMLVAGLFNKARVIVYHNPFEGLSDEWAEKIALFIAEAAEQSKKIVFITGVSMVPKVWARHQAVTLEGELSIRQRKLSAIEGELADTMAAVRKLMRTSWNLGQSAGVLVTRPQSIAKHSNRISTREKLKTEAISNPNVELSQEARSEDENLATKSDSPSEPAPYHPSNLGKSVGSNGSRSSSGSIRRASSGSFTRPSVDSLQAPDKRTKSNTGSTNVLKRSSSGSIDQKSLTSVPWYQKLLSRHAFLAGFATWRKEQSQASKRKRSARNQLQLKSKVSTSADERRKAMLIAVSIVVCAGMIAIQKFL